MANENTTPGSSPGGQSDPLGVNFAGMDMAALANGGGGFDITSTDTNNPEQFGQHPPSVDGQPDATKPAQTTTPNQPAQPQQNLPSQPQQPAQQNQPAQNQPQSQPQPQDLAAIVRTVMQETAPAIATAAVNANAEAQRRVAPTTSPDMTPEQLDKMFNVVRLTPRDMEALGLDHTNDGARAALEGLIHRGAQMGAKVAEFQAKQQIAELKQLLGPVIEHVQSQQVQGLKDQFYSAHPNLKDHEELLVAIHSGLNQQGFKGTNAQWFDAMAKSANAILSKAGVNTTGQPTSTAVGTPSAPATQQQPTNGGNATHRMTPLSGGGQGGAATGAGGNTDTREAGWKVWD